jgi:hypothetical protein
MKDQSPFTPGNPVPIELFVGRKKEIEEILRYIKRSTTGRQENIFLTGERGIGKSSLGKYIRQLAVVRENILTIHIHLGGVQTVDDVVVKIFDNLLKETYKQTWFNKIKDFFGKHITEVGLFGVTVAFHPPKDSVVQLKMNFAEALMNTLGRIRDEKTGLLIILDDIDSLAKTDEFANWYKSFVDHVGTHFTNCPITVILIGLPEIRDSMAEQQESLMRIFRVIHIEKLTNDEVKSFFKTAFDQVHISVDTDAMKIMTRYSGGLPLLMHGIGDEIFWNNEDDKIDEVDALVGVNIAANTIGRKYLNPKIYQTIRNPRYKSILTKIGERFSHKFDRSEIEKDLTDDEKRVFNNFLRKMREKGIIIQDTDNERGSYKFVNELYFLYLAISRVPSKNDQMLDK